MDTEKTFLASDGIFVTDENGNQYLLFPLTTPTLPTETSVESILLSLGIPNVLDGFTYIVSAVHLLKEHPNYSHSFCANVYPKVAKKHNTKDNTVAKEITYALLHCQKNAKYKKLFGNVKKMTNVRFITALAKII